MWDSSHSSERTESVRFEVGFLHSKVARRIFVLFIVCAILPITALAVLVFGHVTGQLKDQSYGRLQQGSKAVGMAILERLAFLDAEMRLMIPDSSGADQEISVRAVGALGHRLDDRFEWLAAVDRNRDCLTLLGEDRPPPRLSSEQLRHLESGRAVVLVHHPESSEAEVFICVSAKGAGRTKWLFGHVNPGYLWWGALSRDTLPASTEFLVLDGSSRVLVSSLPVTDDLLADLAGRPDDPEGRRFEIESGGRHYLACWWTVFLRYAFFEPKWTVILAQTKSDVLAPVSDFKKIFPLVLLAALGGVALMSLIQIRRSLVPLVRLKEGILRVACRDFATPVRIESGDEFQELAEAFNTMSRRLHRQFDTLETIALVDRAILSALHTRVIVDTVLSRMQDIFPCRAAAMGLFRTEDPWTATLYLKGAGPSQSRSVTVALDSAERKALLENPEFFSIDTDQDVPGYINEMRLEGIKTVWVLPILVMDRLAGIIVLGYPDPSWNSAEDAAQVRQLADQVGVALSNAHLLEELQRLNWGTIRALARAVDAKSPWTAGHSERVTTLALRTGRRLGLDRKDLEILRRGALLHDIGKIGVSAAVLDKPGALTPDEFKEIREHPRIGARILEPISAYADVVPLVLQHHERFDGKGYPEGLAGEAISPGARILAVADVFDALSSDRPYRGRWERGDALAHIEKGAGTQFDPEVVATFLRMMAEAIHVAGLRLDRRFGEVGQGAVAAGDERPAGELGSRRKPRWVLQDKPRAGGRLENPGEEVS